MLWVYHIYPHLLAEALITFCARLFFKGVCIVSRLLSQRQSPSRTEDGFTYCQYKEENVSLWCNNLGQFSCRLLIKGWGVLNSKCSRCGANTTCLASIYAHLHLIPTEPGGGWEGQALMEASSSFHSLCLMQISPFAFTPPVLCLVPVLWICGRRSC